MKEKFFNVYFVDTDPNLIVELWEALDGYVPSEYPNLKIEIWSVDNEVLWEIIGKDETNPYYDEEPKDLEVLNNDPACLKYRYPKLQLFTYFYKGIDNFYKRKEEYEEIHPSM